MRTRFFWLRFVLAFALLLTVVPLASVIYSAMKWVPYFVRGFLGDIGWTFMSNANHLALALRQHFSPPEAK